MTYQDDERSLQDARPTWLLDWFAGTEHWRSTPGPVPFVYESETYLAEPGLDIKDIESADDPMSSTLEVVTRWGHALPRAHLAGQLEDVLELCLYRGHDPNFVPFWRGFLSNISHRAEGQKEEAVLQHVGCAEDLGVAGEFPRWGKTCTAVPFGTYCGLDAADWTIPGVIETVTGNVIVSATFAGYSDNWFRLGWVRANNRRRMVVNHMSDTVTLSGPIYGLVAGMPFTACLGCNHLFATCGTKFDHALDYKGNYLMPSRNVFTGGLR